MKRRNHTGKLIAIALSTVLAASVMLSSPISALAAGTEETAELTAVYDVTDATSFVFTDEGVTVTEGAYTGYKLDGTSLTIKESGTYVLSGTCKNGSVTVKKGVTGVTLILNGLELTASATAPITCNKGSQVTIVAAAGTVSSLADDQYNNDDIYTDETLYPDIENAVIKCKDGSNVTIAGTGTLNIVSNGKNGIKGGADLYEEDEEGNATDVLVSEASLTIKDLTLNVTANVNDGIKSDKLLNILSGSITVSAADDGIKSDCVMNIGAQGTEGPTVTVTKSNEGIEAATLNVYSGNITVNASDDGINAANSDLTNYKFSYNQYGGYVYVNVTNGDGIDSNGTINLMGGTLEVYTPSQGDGDPLDADGGTTFGGTTVLAVGNLAMAQAYSAGTPYVTFGSASGGQMGGRMGGMQSSSQTLVTAGSSIQITDESGTVLYTGKALRNAGYILFASPELTAGSTYTLKNGSSAVASASASTASAGGMGGRMGGMQGQMGGRGQQSDASSSFGGRTDGMQGQMPGANDAPSGFGRGTTPPELPAQDQTGEMPAQGQTPDFRQGGMQAQQGREGFSRGGMNRQTQTQVPADTEAGDSQLNAEEASWIVRMLESIITFLRNTFGIQ